MSVPLFQADGLLPPGDYTLTLDELRSSSLVLGPDDPKKSPLWDARSRELQLDWRTVEPELLEWATTKAGGGCSACSF